MERAKAIIAGIKRTPSWLKNTEREREKARGEREREEGGREQREIRGRGESLREM